MEMSGHLHAPADLPPGKESEVPIGYEARCGSRAGLDAVEDSKIPALVGSLTPAVHPLGHRYTY
jgi:hypothetical protein